MFKPIFNDPTRVRRLHWAWSPALALVCAAPWFVLDPVRAEVVKHGWFLTAVGFGTMLGFVELALRPMINENLERIAGFYQVHAESQTCQQPIALVLRSFSRTHGYLDSESGFSILWFLDDALRTTRLRPVLLGIETSLPPDHRTLLLPSRDEDWQAIFETVADAAAVIFLVPETTSSLVTELSTLRARGWLEKTILIMAPESISKWAGDARAGGDDRQRQERWEESRSTLALNELAIPRYDAAGALVEVTADGGVSAVTSLEADLKSVLSRSGFWDRVSPSPDMPARQERFSAIWRQIQNRRRFAGRPIAAVYSRICSGLPELGMRDVFHPPGGTRSLASIIGGILLIGWGLPLGSTLIDSLF